MPDDRILVETDSPYLSPQPVRGRPNEPAHLVHTIAALADVRGVDAVDPRARRRTRTRRGRSACRDAAGEEVARPALPRRRELPRCHRPPRRARARGRRARDRSRDRHPHAVSRGACGNGPRASSSTASLEETLEDALRGATNVDLVFADAVTFDYATLDPPPTKLVSNLPYNVATPIVVESLERIPSLERWVVMVQREVAERFFASPRTKAYGAVSVLLQLHTRKLGSHRVPPTAFRPRPRVDSAIVAFERYPGPRLDLVRPVVESAFAHRRKTLANSLAHCRVRLAGRGGACARRRSAASPASVPRSSHPRSSSRLGEGARMRTDRGPREDQPRPRRRADREPTGSTRWSPCFSVIASADTIAVERIRRAGIVVEGFEDTIVQGALTAFAEATRRRARLAGADRQAHPGRGRSGRRELRRGARRSGSRTS